MAKKKSYANETLEQRYKRLAKAADQRLVRLEKLTDKKGFENVLDYAYQNAMKAISHWSGSQGKRFNRDMPKTQRGLKAKIADIEEFLHMKSSSKAQIKKSYINVANKTNKLYGTDLKWTDLEDLYKSAQWEKLEKEYGSKTAAKTVGQIQENKDYIKKMLKNKETINFNIKDQKVKKAVEDTIKEYGIDVVDLF